MIRCFPYFFTIYYQKIKEMLQKMTRERYQGLSEKGKTQKASIRL